VNITQVNITLPTNFTFNLSSDGTNASDVVLVNFTNITGNILIWTNDTFQFYLLNETNTTTFWFNASASYPGTYEINISVMNTTDTYGLATNISVEVNDTTAPNASFGTNPINVTNASTTGVTFDLKCSDGYAVNDIEFWGNFSSGTWALNQTNATNVANDSFWNVSLNLSDGRYIWGVYCDDSAGNSDWTDTNRTLIVDTTDPAPSASCTASTLSKGSALTCSCSATDATSGVNASATTAGSTPDTSNTGTFTYTCSATDYSGNSASSTFTYAISGSGGGASSGSTSFYTQGTFIVSDQQFKDSFTKELSKKQRFKLKVGYETHHVGVVDLTTSTATINISSDPQQIILTVGDERKVEVNNDKYYDVLVTLNSIDNNKANITIKSINELITDEQVSEEQQNQEASEELKDIEAPGEPPIDTESNLLWLWILIQ